MEIPYTLLESDTLRNLVEEFVTREGTDYGTHVYNLHDKVRHVFKQLEQGSAVIVYDSESETCHIEARERLSQWKLPSES
jgi:uncharacterized protein YheU (UPF0270 family)